MCTMTVWYTSRNVNNNKNLTIFLKKSSIHINLSVLCKAKQKCWCSFWMFGSILPCCCNFQDSRTTPSWSSLWLCGLEASGFLKPYITLPFSIKWHLFRFVQCSAESPVFTTVVPTEWKASGLCQTHVALSGDLWFRLALILMTMKNPFSVCVEVC